MREQRINLMEIENVIKQALVDCGFNVESKDGHVKGIKEEKIVNYSAKWILRTMKKNEDCNSIYLNIFDENKEKNEGEGFESEPYVTNWITEKERIALPENIFEEMIDDKLIVYATIEETGIKVYASVDEAKNNPWIIKSAQEYYEIIESYNYEIQEFEEENFIRIIDHFSIPEPRCALLTNAVQTILTEKYGESMYIVTTERNDLFAFGLDENPFELVGNIMESKLGALSSSFDVILLEKNQLTNVLKITQFFEEIC